MLDINVRITAPELCDALNNLARALAAGPITATPEIVQTASEPEHLSETAPWPPADPAPIPTPPAPERTPLPTAAPPAYTLAQIQTACAPLLDAGMFDQLSALNQQFGIPSLMQLPEAQYGAYVTALRGLGARI